MLTEHAGEIWYVCSVPAALMLFGLAFFFFVFGILPWWFKIHKRLDEILGCWSLTFPNGTSFSFPHPIPTDSSVVGWILSLRKIGDTFDCQFFWTWNIVMTVAMCVTWTVLITLTITAFCQGKIFTSPREDIIKDSVLRMKLRRHVEDLEAGRSRCRFQGACMSQDATPQAQSPRSRSPSRSNSGVGSATLNGAAMGLAGVPMTAKKFVVSGSPPLDSGMSTPSSGPGVTFC